jgi:hypothetical protein
MEYARLGSTSVQDLRGHGHVVPEPSPLHCLQTDTGTADVTLRTPDAAGAHVLADVMQGYDRTDSGAGACDRKELGAGDTGIEVDCAIHLSIPQIRKSLRPRLRHLDDVSLVNVNVQARLSLR